MNFLTSWWFWFVITLTAGLVLLTALFVKMFPAILTRVAPLRKQPGEKLVSLLGDSITEGTMSYNFVNILAQRVDLVGYRFMNAGISGDTAYNLLKRMDTVVESQPDYVAIMIGTNDMQAYLRGGQMTPQNQRMKKLPQAVTLEWYISILRQMLQRMQQETPAKKIAICSIPIMGEDLESRSNQSIRLFNQSLKVLAEEFKIAYLPVYENMDGFLRTHQQQQGESFDESRFGKLMLKAAWDHNILGRSWDGISASNNLLLTVDTIHFNGRGAKIIADLIGDWLLNKDPQIDVDHWRISAT